MHSSTDSHCPRESTGSIIAVLPPRLFDRTQHSAGLVHALLPLLRWNRIRNNARSCLHMPCAAPHHERTDRNATVKITAEVRIKNAAAVHPTPRRFQLLNN